MEKLVEDIEKYCLCGYNGKMLTYNDNMTACYVAVWCTKNDVRVDTANWDTLIDYLWEHLDSKKLALEFENKNDFDMSCGRHLC
jgi:uncharacterized protein YjaG (DUF416 family)